MKIKILISLLLVSLTSPFAFAESQNNFEHYVKSEWSSGYCYRFEIDNISSEYYNAWNVSFDIDSPIRSTYSALFAKNGNSYSVTGKSWNKNLKPGKDTRFGFCVDSKDTVENVVFSHTIIQEPINPTLFEASFSPDWIQNWNLESGRQWGFENFTLNSNNELEVTYPAGSYKPSAAIRGGGGFIKKLSDTNNDSYLSYDVKFDEGFDFVKGGKLPGLCGGECSTGSGIRGEGFSSRFMWRTAGDLEIYGYLHDKTDGYGTSLGRGSARMETGKWYTLTQRVKLNTPGNNDGIIEFFVDGVKVYSNTSVNVIGNTSTKIDGVLFSTFFGGGDASWATPNDTKSSFRNFKVFTK